MKDNIEIDLNESQAKTNGARHHDAMMIEQANTNGAGYVPSTLFEGRAMAELEERLASHALATPMKTSSQDDLSHILSHSLGANDLETISYALS